MDSSGIASPFDGPQGDPQTGLQQCHGATAGPGAAAHQLRHRGEVDAGPVGDRAHTASLDFAQGEHQEPNLLGRDVIAGLVGPRAAESSRRVEPGTWGHDGNVVPASEYPGIYTRNTEEFARRVAGFLPRQVDLEEWLAVRPFVHDVLSRFGTVFAPHDNQPLIGLTRLAIWAHCLNRYELTTEQVLDPVMIHAFLRDAQRHRGMSSQWSQKLHLLSPWSSRCATARYQCGTTWSLTQRETDAMWDWALGQRSGMQRRRALVYLTLGLGAGLQVKDIGGLRVRHILFEQDRILVGAPRSRYLRVVPVNPPWDDFLRHAADDLTPDDLVLMPGLDIEPRRAMQRFYCTMRYQGTAVPSLPRLNRTWAQQAAWGALT